MKNLNLELEELEKLLDELNNDEYGNDQIFLYLNKYRKCLKLFKSYLCNGDKYGITNHTKECFDKNKINICDSLGYHMKRRLKLEI